MMKSNFFGLFQFIEQKFYQITRHPFPVNAEYFEELYKKHYTKEFRIKYSEKLFVDQDKGQGEKLLDEITLDSKLFSPVENEIRILRNWLEEFNSAYEKLKGLLSNEGITINERSPQFIQLEKLSNNVSELLQELTDLEQSIVKRKKNLPLNLNLLSINIGPALGLNINQLHEYPIEERFIDELPTETFPIVIVFRRLSEISLQIPAINRLVEKLSYSNLKVVHGNAGMGKSNFSAFIFNKLHKKQNPCILIAGKSFKGDPDNFNKIFMDQLNVPDNYRLEEVLKKLNDHGKSVESRVTLIFDGLNETSFGHQGFSKIWLNSLDNFISLLENYPYIYFIVTLRTSYISRIWKNDSIPYENIQLTGFESNELEKAIELYFEEYNIKFTDLAKEDVFFFRTPLFLDLYCQMLNGNKKDPVDPILGLKGFQDVFANYISELADKVYKKLDLISPTVVKSRMKNASQEMMNELGAFLDNETYYHCMDGNQTATITNSIGHEILQEYLIYLEENQNGIDVIIHTQQEVGGFLIANYLIEKYGDVNKAIKSDFFKEYLLGESGTFHQLKDDILKFLIANSDDPDDLLYSDYLNHESIRKISLINLQREKVSPTNTVLTEKLAEQNYSNAEILNLLFDNRDSFTDFDANINFLFVEKILRKLSNIEMDWTWTFFIYNHKSYLNRFIELVKNPSSESPHEAIDIGVKIVIWLLESTIRDFRDKATLILLQYFEEYPEKLLPYLSEYSTFNRLYIYERLALITYGVSLRLQNNSTFLKNHLGPIAEWIHNSQFSKTPISPTYNYIVIDSFKHIIDLSVLKGAYNLDEESLNRIGNYEFVLDNWFEINESDLEAVPIASSWSLDTNPDPLAGDFVHYTLPRLKSRNDSSLLDLTANIYKEIKRLGYKNFSENLSSNAQSFFSGTSLIGNNSKVDRLGKKYSWMAYFNYAGYLLQQKELSSWSEDDSIRGKYYKRLGDVDIDPSCNNLIRKNEQKPLISKDFFASRNLDDKTWTTETHYHILPEILSRDDQTLLGAFIDQKKDEHYKTRSYLEVKSFFVTKNQLLDKIEALEGREFDWKEDLNDNGTLTDVYFGELYWADTIPVFSMNYHNLSLLEYEETTRQISHNDVLYSDEFDYEDIGKEIKEKVSKQCSFEYEPTLTDFLWESNSKILESLRSYIPNIRMGKDLNLTTNSQNAKILSSDLKECFTTRYFEKDLNHEELFYFNTELLEKFLKENDLLLLYQLKQHTYDNAADNPPEHFRGMQFSFSELNR